MNHEFLTHASPGNEEMEAVYGKYHTHSDGWCCNVPHTQLEYQIFLGMLARDMEIFLH